MNNSKRTTYEKTLLLTTALGIVMIILNIFFIYGSYKGIAVFFWYGIASMLFFMVYFIWVVRRESRYGNKSFNKFFEESIKLIRNIIIALNSLVIPFTNIFTEVDESNFYWVIAGVWIPIVLEIAIKISSVVTSLEEFRKSY